MSFWMQGVAAAKGGISVSWVRCTITYTIATGYDKTINDISDYTHINDISVDDISAWNDIT